jgi:hypothetical protein
MLMKTYDMVTSGIPTIMALGRFLDSENSINHLNKHFYQTISKTLLLIRIFDFFCGVVQIIPKIIMQCRKL